MNCFNGERYLRVALESVLNQTFPDWELLLWDNQSTDDSARIANSYSDSRIRYFLSSEHTGLGEARRLVSHYVTGEWIAVLDVDDYWLPGNLEKKLSNPINPDIGILYSRYVVDQLQLGRKSFVMPKRVNLPDGFIYSRLTKKNIIGLITALYRKTAVDQVGGFRNFPLGADYDLNLRISKYWKVLAIDEVTSVYRLHGLNGSILDAENMNAERVGVTDEISEEFRANAKATIFVDQIERKLIGKQNIRVSLNDVPLWPVLMNVFSRIKDRLWYEVSSEKKRHSKIIKQMLS
jgi:glycosyltransferase involved in cell wall biosynthesis